MKHEARIPKIIHWCWLSGEPVPEFLRECMASWKRRMPDYVLKCWTQENFDIHAVKWVEEAVEERKWAFAADYIRLYALHTNGGIYLDSDVEVFRPFDKLLGYEFFTGTEYSPIDYKYADVPIDAQGIPLDRDAFVPGYGIQAAIMGAAKGSGFVRECMDYYEGRHFREADGRLRTDLTMPLVIAKIAERHGFRYLDKEQVLGGGRLYISRFDGRLHLYGAETGIWRIDQNTTYYQGWDRLWQRRDPERFATVRYTDRDGNGFFDCIEYDLDGDRTFETTVDLKALGVDDRCELIDVSGFRYGDYTKLMRRMADDLWRQAQQAVKVAERHGLNTSWYAKLKQAASIRERYHKGYWLQYYLYRDLEDKFAREGRGDLLERLNRAYFSADWKGMNKK